MKNDNVLLTSFTQRHLSFLANPNTRKIFLQICKFFQKTLTFWSEHMTKKIYFIFICQIQKFNDL